MRRARGVARFTGDLVRYGARTGRWWVPVVTVVLGVAALLVVLVKVAAPTVVYTFF